MVAIVSVDGTYSDAAAVAIASLARHAPGDLEVWLLTADVTPAQERLLRRAARSARLFHRRLTPAELSLPVCSDYITAATFGRLYLGEILPETYSRALYLDADVLVLGDVRELWELDLRGHVVGAVVEPTAPTLGSERGLQHVAELGFDPELPYFNAGVLLVDLDEWRRAEIGRRAIEHIRRLTPVLMDQDALNAVLVGRWIEIDPIWNLTEYWFRNEKRQARFADVLERARIVHYVGRKKPWLRPDRWAAEIWRGYLEELRS
jgi:lipopolysaccharide biosynthesis glycosyltransferase